MYRELDMKNHPPPRDEAIRLMSENPNLIRRPILIDRKLMILGFNEPEYEQAVSAAK
jgi:arsenate reductase-like glutaredoxin family protein